LARGQREGNEVRHDHADDDERPSTGSRAGREEHGEHDADSGSRRPETASPTIGSSRKGFRIATPCVSLPSRKIAKVATATAAASSIVQPKSVTSGCGKAGSSKVFSEMSLVLSPVNDPRPIQASDPIPEASRPGTSTSGNLGPPRPVASIRMTAAMIGELNRNPSAEKAPAAASRPPPPLARPSGAAWQRRSPSPRQWR
jgi:hypothetical protein